MSTTVPIDSALTVVGGGRIGGMLLELARQARRPSSIRGRTGETASEGGGGPIVVCTRNDALLDVIERTPPSRRQDLVFVQNGVLEPWLRTHGLSECTIGVLYVAVDRRGATPVPGAPSVFGGRHAQDLAALLNGGGVTAVAAPDDHALRSAVGTKLAWICILGVLGDALELSVGELVTAHSDDIAALAEELQPVLLDHAFTSAPDDLVDQLLSYSRSVAHYRTAIKEWDWRTGWLLDAASELGHVLPLHRDWLKRAGQELSA